MDMGRIISYALFAAGLILVGMSGFYILQIVRLSLWEDVIFRIVSVMAFIGGGVFIGLSRILINQNEIIQLLRKSSKDNLRSNAISGLSRK